MERHIGITCPEAGPPWTLLLNMAIQQKQTIDDEGYDFTLDGVGDQALVSGSEEVALHLKQRLQFFLSEWLFDTGAGTPWFQRIFTRPLDKNLADSIIKRRILQTDGVTSLVSYESQFVRENRNFRVDFRYTDQYTDGEQILGITI